ncbi:MAG: hypothetical protein QOH96_1259, partial [Blastocatellia bacterium]|nr:hypothetical protein [Blastocatellia bacterium]
YTEHSANNRRRSLGSLSRAFDRMAYGSYARVVAVNNSAHSNLTTWLPETRRKSVMIPNSVRVFKHTAPTVTEKREMLNELGLSAVSTPNLILFAGRLTHVKGADLLLSALAQLKRCDYFCLIAGDGPEREMLEATAASLGLSDKIKFLGARKDVTNLLGLADFLVMPSRWEGLPLIMLEAMAAGCPIVGTSVDGTAEVLRNEVTALLAPAEDVNALAHCIERLIESPELRHSLSSKASLAVLDYSAEKIAPQLLGLYDELLQGAGTEVLGKLQ